MCMNPNQINDSMKELQELRRMREELDQEITALEDAFKEYMKETDTYEINTLTGKITWLERTSNRFDSAAFKREVPELYKRYCKPSCSRYFVLCK